MGFKDEIQNTLNIDLDFKLSRDEQQRWYSEYKRIGGNYATWGAIFAIFGGPSILLSEMNSNIDNTGLWLFYRLLPSVTILIGFLLFKYAKFSHEFLFLVIAYSLFVNFAYWPDCHAPDKFLYGQLTLLIPAAIITMLRPFFFVINIFVQFALILLFYSHYCQEPVSNFLGSKEFVPILIASVSCYMVAAFRYFLAKRNFLFSIKLEHALQLAEAGKKKSDELLRNILPEEIAEELKEFGNSNARSHDLVTIIFTDFENFTERASGMTAIELVAEIDRNFKAFDLICEKHKVEKIKTIGDAYMAASGLPVPKKDAARNAVLAALEMQEFVTKHYAENKKAGKVAFEMRAGLHSGPVVAGIVGVKKFQYDIWGDTVNTASRMETNSQIGKINISEATYQLLKNDSEFVFENRGKIEVKGKGEMEMYFVARA